jgi:hypothetical protein
VIRRQEIIDKYGLKKNERGFYVDEYGTIWALPDVEEYTDNDIRLGIGILNLPGSYYLTPAAQAHDYAYSSIVWQEFHSRRETDRLFRLHVEKLGGTALEILLLYGAVRLFGSLFWEN